VTPRFAPAAQTWGCPGFSIIAIMGENLTRWIIPRIMRCTSTILEDEIQFCVPQQHQGRELPEWARSIFL